VRFGAGIDLGPIDSGAATPPDTHPDPSSSEQPYKTKQGSPHSLPPSLQ
jgi:hypothetical protein